MPGETTTYKYRYAIATDEIRAFPAEVDQPSKEKIDKVGSERWLSEKKYSGAATLKTGELAIQEKNAETFTLPAVGTVDQIIGVYSLVAETKITTSGGAFIIGGFLPASTATIKVVANGYVELRSNGTAWMWTAGEPKPEATYSEATRSSAELKTGFIPSTGRRAFVTVSSAKEYEIEVGTAVVAANHGTTGGLHIGFMVQPGQTWKAGGATAETSIVSTLLL